MFSSPAKATLLPIFLLLIFLSCSDKEDPAPIMTIVGKEAILLEGNKVKLTAEIKNFRNGEITDCGFIVNSIKHSVGIPTSNEIELVIEGLEALTDHKWSPYFITSSSTEKRGPQSLAFTSGTPYIESFSPTIVSDFILLTIKGDGFNDNTFFYVLTRPAPSKEEEKHKLITKNITSNEIQVYSPSLGARGTDTPAFFEGPIQPCALYVGNEDGTILEKVGDLDYTYRFSLPQKGGSIKETFKVTIWYARTNPSLEEIKVYLGENQCTLTNKKLGFDIGPGFQFIEAYHLEYKIPAGTEPGTYNVKVFSPYEEEFISISSTEYTIE